MFFFKNTLTTVVTGVYSVDIAVRRPGKTFDVIVVLDAENPTLPYLDRIESTGFKSVQAATYVHRGGEKCWICSTKILGSIIFRGGPLRKRIRTCKR